MGGVVKRSIGVVELVVCNEKGRQHLAARQLILWNEVTQGNK